MIHEIRTATITEKGQIALPKSFRELNGFKKGDKIALISFKEKIEIIPLSKINEKMETAYASEKVLSKDWNTKQEDEVWKDL
jgi:AbrB family looped-hinge helix DNA binding protein